MDPTRSTLHGAALAALALAMGACASPADATGEALPLDPLDIALAEEPLHRHLDVPIGLDGTGNQLVTPVLSDGSPFTEALPSWNVAGGAPFEVDLRVRSAGTPWSPWLRIGDWNVPARTAEVTTTFDRGRVAVDVLELIEPMDELQLAFRAVDPSRPLRPDQIRASVVLSDLTELETEVARAASEPWPSEVRHEVPTRSQREDGGDIGHRICSPTSVAMVASFHGQDVPTTTMAGTLLDPHHDIYGNWNRAVQGARSHGVRGRLLRLSSWQTIAAILETGTPIIASIRAKEGELRGAPYKKTAGHLLVVTGLGPEGAVHVNDPAARSSADVRRVYAREDIERVWLANGGVAYLLEGPAADPTPAAGSAR